MNIALVFQTLVYVFAAYGVMLLIGQLSALLFYRTQDSHYMPTCLNVPNMCEEQRDPTPAPHEFLPEEKEETATHADH